MKHLIKTATLLTLAIVTTSNAKSWDKQQAEVWNVVTTSYQDIEKKDNNWTDKWVTADAMVWGAATPMPRDRASVKRWEKFQFADGATNEVSDYSPTAIVVHGDTAIAHYYYSSGVTLKSGKHNVSHGRCTDVLVRDNKSWKFVAWHCADEPKKN